MSERVPEPSAAEKLLHLIDLLCLPMVREQQEATGRKARELVAELAGPVGSVVETDEITTTGPELYRLVSACLVRCGCAYCRLMRKLAMDPAGLLGTEAGDDTRAALAAEFRGFTVEQGVAQIAKVLGKKPGGKES